MPIIGSVCDEYADEKIAIEVEQYPPVPGTIAWGLTDANPLGLGPYIVMNFIEGVARIIQLFQIDFPVLGSLPTAVTGFNAPVRPLTFKAYDILQTGGVDTFGCSDTTDYFCYLADQDWAQFQCQPNSDGGPTVTQAKYAALCALQAVAPQLVEPSYVSGPYKLVCDDLSLPNLIVRSADDLTVVGVVDLEWSYAGPAQLFGSAPWWLLQDRLNIYDTFLDNEEAPRVLERYLRNLDVFKIVLEEDEARMPGTQFMELSRQERHSKESGSMWQHILLSWGFNHPDSLPFMQL
ncbi:hypothetical protein M433DRAFT_135741 [Acidomyces richmondensis BFW]|nr:hypothetical protein M433DRAFT_135741 [Acidomyces richmondensis BFW]